MERDGSGPGSLGLSQSLGANGVDKGAANRNVNVAAGGSKDDFGIAGKRRSMGKMDEAKVRELLVHMWNRDGPGSVDLSASN